jgi:hypothetical protein
MPNARHRGIVCYSEIYATAIVCEDLPALNDRKMQWRKGKRYEESTGKENRAM